MSAPRLTYASTVEAMIGRWQVGTNWASGLRIAAWAIVFALLFSGLFGAIWPDAAPTYLDREIEPDQPPSGVRYIAPVRSSDTAGFLAPPGSVDEYNVAWIGASDVKLNSVSVAGEFDNRVSTVGGKPLVIDGYTFLGMRAVEVYWAFRSAIHNDADAIVVALGPSLLNDGSSLRNYPNLDVHEAGALLADPGTAPLELYFTSPGDLALNVAGRASSIVAARGELDERQQGWFDGLDVLRDASEDAPIPEIDERLPADASTFWLRQRDLSFVEPTIDQRLHGILEGFGVGDSVSNSLVEAILDLAAESDIPVLLYPTPLNPAWLNDPKYAADGDLIAPHWESFLHLVDGERVILRTEMYSRAFGPEVLYHDATHPVEAGPIADVLVGELCRQWVSLDPEQECAP